MDKSKFRASCEIYFFLLFILICIAVIILNGLPDILKIASDIATLIVVIAAVLGLVVAVIGAIGKGSSIIAHWQYLKRNARNVPLLIISLLTVVAIIVVLSIGILPFLQHDPYTHQGILWLNDPLSNNSKGYNWEETPDSSGVCSFTEGAYHVSEKQQGIYEWCPSGSEEYKNFVFQVQMTFIKGDFGGVVFSDNQHEMRYFFGIQQDGQYKLIQHRFDQKNTLDRELEPDHSFTRAFITGVNETNTIAFMVRSSFLELYINEKPIFKYYNLPQNSQGLIGVFAEDISHPSEVEYKNAMLWKL